MSLVDSRFSVGRARWWRQPPRLSHPERSRGGSEPLRSTWMSKALQERTPVGQRRFTPLLQSLASRKPTSVLAHRHEAQFDCSYSRDKAEFILELSALSYQLSAKPRGGISKLILISLAASW